MVALGGLKFLTSEVQASALVDTWEGRHVTAQRERERERARARERERERGGEGEKER